MLFIMGFSTAVAACCDWMGFAGCSLAAHMRHVRWEGFAHHDTIFPLFLFIAGVTWPFSCATQEERGRSRGRMALRILRRMLLLVALGLVYNGLLNLDFAHLRLPSVLSRIGIAWACAAMLHLFVRRVSLRMAIGIALLVGSWALLFFLRAPGAPADVGGFDPKWNLAGHVDRLVFGCADPEGILSTFPAIVTAMLGTFCGELLRSDRLSGVRKTLTLVGSGLAMLALGFVWRPWCPVIKCLWTPTFVLFAGAYSVLGLALFYWMCDVMMWRKWTYFFRVIGMNAIAIYLLRRIVDFGGISRFFFGGFASCFPKAGAVAVLALGEVVVGWVVLWFLHRRQVYFKV